jgi:hypothetical protein
MRRALAVVIAFGALVALPSTAIAATATTFHLKVPAVARVFASTCLELEVPPAVDTHCEDWVALYFREEEPNALRDAPWVLSVAHSAATLHPDGTETVHFDAVGFVENPIGAFDLKRYTFAQVSAAVPMSDGSVFDVHLRWNMADAPLHHGGNVSLFNVEFGIDRHYVDRCVTLINLAHQQWRAGPPGVITGSFAGVDVQSIPLASNEPFIAGRSLFTYAEVAHGECAT